MYWHIFIAVNNNVRIAPKPSLAQVARPAPAAYFTQSSISQMIPQQPSPAVFGLPSSSVGRLQSVASVSASAGAPFSLNTGPVLVPSQVTPLSNTSTTQNILGYTIPGPRLMPHKISYSKDLKPFTAYFPDKTGVTRPYVIRQPRIKLTRLSKAILTHLASSPLRVYDKVAAEKRRRARRAARRHSDSRQAVHDDDISDNELSKKGVEVRASPAKSKGGGAIEVVSIQSDEEGGKADGDDDYKDGVRQLPPPKKTFPLLSKSLTDMHKKPEEDTNKSKHQLKTDYLKEQKELNASMVIDTLLSSGATKKTSPVSAGSASESQNNSTSRNVDQDAPAQKANKSQKALQTLTTSVPINKKVYGHKKKIRHKPGRLIPSFTKMTPPPVQSKLSFPNSMPPKGVPHNAAHLVNGRKTNRKKDDSDDDDIIVLN